MIIRDTKGIQILCVISLCFQSCATLLGGRVDSCQTTRPAVGGKQREIRPAALIGDILLFPPGIAIDFISHAMYKPCKDVQKERKEMQAIDPVYGK